MRYVAFRESKQLDQRWITLASCVDTARKGAPQTECGCCQLNLVNGNHGSWWCCSLILFGTGHDDARGSPRDAVLAAIPRFDKDLQVGFLVERSVLFLH